MAMQMVGDAEVAARQRALGGFLLRRWRAAGADAARDHATLDTAVGGGVVVGERVCSTLARGEEGGRRAVVFVRRAVDADSVFFAGRIAFDALVEELDVAARHGGIPDRTRDRNRVGVYVADINGARPVAEAGFDEGVGNG